MITGETVDAHMSLVRERYAEHETDEGKRMLLSRARAIAAAATPAARKRLLGQAAAGKSVAQRIHWLRQESDLVQRASEGNAACKAGCSHCCNISTLVPEAEARHIAREIGRELSDPAVFASPLPGETVDEARQRNEHLKHRYFGVPCTFLGGDNRCGIYEHRPMACRQLINVDRDDLLCQLVEGVAVDVPYVNTQTSQLVHIAALGTHGRVADLRDWFPAPSRKA